MKMLEPTAWADYEIIDTGNRQRLERFGSVVVVRPEPQAIWKRQLPEAAWDEAAGVFLPTSANAGKWVTSSPQLPKQWTIHYPLSGRDFRFVLKRKTSKHLGIFPEQDPHWRFIDQAVRKHAGARVLNLFGYTGCASLVARAAGAEVTHCDAVLPVIDWAKENLALNGLGAIRFVVEDAFSFVKREVKAGKTYHGIILDPPAYGVGPKGERWRLEEKLRDLLQQVAHLLHPDQSFLVFNCYAMGFSALILENLLPAYFGKRDYEVGELLLSDRSGRRLSTGVFGRF